MRKILLISAILPAYLLAQVTEDFSDGDIIQDPVWTGDTSYFKISSSSAVPQAQWPVLQLEAPSAGVSALSVDQQLYGDLEWHFWVKLSMNTSSGNFARIYLFSDEPDLKSPLNGYCLQIGGTEDSVIFYRQDSLELTQLFKLNTAFTGNSTNTLRFKVKRSQEGLWKFYCDSLGGQSLTFQGEIEEITLPGGGYFGFSCQYTSSNTTKFYFDDFYTGPLIIDTVPPALLTAELVNPLEVLLTFSETVDRHSAEDVFNFEITPGIGHPYEALNLLDPSQVHLFFDHELESGIEYVLNISSIKDPEGNESVPVEVPLSYYVIEPFDLVINEVLFNPPEGGVDYVEIYNRSGKTLDLEELSLTSVKNYSTDDPDTNKVSISSSSRVIFPGEYLVLTSDPGKVKSQYYSEDPQAFLELSSLPSYNNDSGRVLLMKNDGLVIDGMDYSEDMHFLLLLSYDGVALERINPNRLGDDQRNWHSAAETAGFGTPGYKNSQYLEINEDDAAVSIQPEVFSPDGDGIDDNMGIAYRFDSPGKLATVLIFNSDGRLVRTLVNNEMPGTEGVFSWDGTLDDRTEARNGIYVIYMEVLGMDGKTKHYKKAGVLARSR